MLNLIIVTVTIHLMMIFPHPCINKGDVQTYHNNAEIMSADKSMRPCNNNDPCNCPGGFFIHIDSVPNPNGKCISCTSFKTMQFPNGFTLGDHTQLPVKVTIDWKYDTLSCDSSRISIINIATR